jgi:hypothetical protein
MTKQAQTTDAYSLTADQATEKLAAMTKAYNATKKSSDPVTDRYADNKGRRDRLFNEDAKEEAHFEEALKAKIESDPTEAAYTGEIGEVPSSSLRQNAFLASILKSAGMHEAIVREAISDEKAPLPRKVYDQLKVDEKRMLSNPEWVKAYQAGNAESEQSIKLLAYKIALMHPIAEDAA